MIFGIFGKFGIEIGTRKKIGRKNVRRKKSENFWSKKMWGPKFSIFVRKKIVEKINEKFSVHLFRSQISPRFQKSHLENCAMRPGTQVPVIWILLGFFPQFETNLLVYR